MLAPPSLITLNGRGSPWAEAGSSFGSGLGQGIQALAQHKMDEMVQQKQIKQYQAQQQQQAQQQAQLQQQQLQREIPFWVSRGATPEQALSIASQPDAVKTQLIKQQQAQATNQPVQQQAAIQQQVAQQVQPQVQPQVQEVQNLAQQDIIKPKKLPKGSKVKAAKEQLISEAEEEAPVAKALPSATYTKKEAQVLLNEYFKAQKANLNNDLKSRHKELKQLITRAPIAPKPQQQVQPQPQVQQPAPIVPQEAAPVAPVEVPKAAGKPAIKPASKAQVAKEEKKAAADDKKNLALLKHYQKYTDEEYATKNSAEEQNANIDLIRDTLKKGNVDSQAYLTGLKAAGLDDVDSFLSGDSQLINKATASMIKGVKSVFGGNVAVGELHAFLKTLPNLLQDPEARDDILATMKHFNNAKIAKADIMDSIIKENGGYPPHDLRSQVDERYKKVQKELAKQFKVDVDRLLTRSEKSQGSSRILNAAAYVGGKVLSNLPKAATGAALGAAAGTRFLPGLGSVGGGILGGLAGLGGLSVKDLLG